MPKVQTTKRLKRKRGKGKRKETKVLSFEIVNSGIFTHTYISLRVLLSFFFFILLFPVHDTQFTNSKTVQCFLDHSPNEWWMLVLEFLKSSVLYIYRIIGSIHTRRKWMENLCLVHFCTNKIVDSKNKTSSEDEKLETKMIQYFDV